MERLDQILSAYAVSPDDNGGVRGKLLAAGFVVVDQTGVLYSKAAGRLDFDPSSPAYDTNSMSWIASMTKLVTATCLLQLWERGVLMLDEDIRPRVPQLAQMQILSGFDVNGRPLLKDNVRPITVRHLLSHTLGLGYDLADPDLTRWSAAIHRTANNLQWSLAGFTTPLKFAPGQGWYYGAAYDWAGHLLTLVTGQTLGAYMQEHIFDPLGMSSTTFWPRKVPLSRERMAAFAFADKHDPAVLVPGPSPLPEEHEMESGGAGLFSTPSDFAKFLHGLLSGKVLSPESTNLMFAPQLNLAQQRNLESIADAAHDALVPEFPRRTRLNHGLAGLINVRDVEGKRRAGSLMWSGMSNGRWWIDRESGIAAAVFTQVLPHGNAVVNKMWDELERTVYAELLPRRAHRLSLPTIR